MIMPILVEILRSMLHVSGESGWMASLICCFVYLFFEYEYVISIHIICIIYIYVGSRLGVPRSFEEPSVLMLYQKGRSSIQMGGVGGV